MLFSMWRPDGEAIPFFILRVPSFIKMIEDWAPSIFIVGRIRMCLLSVYAFRYDIFNHYRVILLENDTHVVKEHDV